MKIDKTRLLRQMKTIDIWKANGYKGTLEAVTGFGKTYVACLIIKQMNDRVPEASTTVIVPTRYLRDQWVDRINELGL